MGPDGCGLRVATRRKLRTILSATCGMLWHAMPTELMGSILMFLLFSYLHSCSPPIIHGNLTCDTIFIQHNGLVKIGSGKVQDKHKRKGRKVPFLFLLHIFLAVKDR